MILARILDSIVATHKHQALEGRHLFWVQPIDTQGARGGDAFVALSSIEAGPGDTVLVCNEGACCRMTMSSAKNDVPEVFPVNHVVIGYVDAVSET